MINKKLLIHGLNNSLNSKNYYNDWAESYEKTLDKWNYQAPHVSTKILLKFANPLPTKILDLACGTGLFAESIKDKLLKSTIDGADISVKSIKIAKKKKIYNKFYQFDFQKKFNFPVNKYDCVSCIGSMTYGENPPSLFSDIKDILKNNGYFLFTHRNDLWKKKIYKLNNFY